jgi:hypothetical protein
MKALLVIRKDQQKLFEQSIEYTIKMHLDIELFPTVVKDEAESDFVHIELGANNGYSLFTAGKNFAHLIMANK